MDEELKARVPKDKAALKEARAAGRAKVVERELEYVCHEPVEGEDADGCADETTVYMRMVQV